MNFHRTVLRRRHRLLMLVLLAVSATIAGCADSHRLESGTIRIEGHEFSVEIARTDAQQQRGLMYRKRMEPDHGMLFVYPSDRRLSFWMKNTRIPLTIAFLASDGRILEIHDMEPESLRSVDSGRSVRYALELNRGAFSRVGAGVGSVVELPDSIE